MTDFIKHAKEAIKTEADSVAALIDRLDENFNRAAEAILQCRGRVIVAGMGKSGLIGKKIAATFNSTGLPSIFLHPAEAMHGDLGLIRSEDILMLISKSGRLGESELLIAAARRLGMTIIGLCGTIDSDLYRRVDIPLDCSVDKEACPNNLAPTSSSTAALVMGDALAVALLEAREFTPEDFAQLHPGGSIGQRLLKRVSELHHTGDAIPLIDSKASIKDMILQMTSKRLGCVLMVDDDRRITGFFADGDLRRLVETREDFFSQRAAEVMIKNPATIAETALIDSALALMERRSITQLPTLDIQGRLVGIIHLHDILKSKLV